VNARSYHRLVRILRRLSFVSIAWLVLGFVIFPLAITVWVAFFSNRIISFPPESYTLSWFTRAWDSVEFRNSFLLSAQIGAVATALALALGVPAAVAITKIEFRGREWVNTLLLSPIMIPAVVAGCAIYLFYIEIEVQSSVRVAGTTPGLLIAHVLIAIPWIVRLVTVSLSGVDKAVEEASMNLGANPFTTFRRIVLPIIKPGIVAGGLFGFIQSFTDLEKSMFLVGPGKQVISVAIVTHLEWQLDPLIMAVSAIQVIIIGAALIVSDRYVKLSRAF
jgi:putative spermidine/putrescine transport system permease protein